VETGGGNTAPPPSPHKGQWSKWGVAPPAGWDVLARPAASKATTLVPCGVHTSAQPEPPWAALKARDTVGTSTNAKIARKATQARQRER
jgi:hypothetical protein